jgi:hypothetical protein
MSWLEVRFCPVQSSAMENRKLAPRVVSMARNTAKLTAASAAPERAR